MNNKKVGICTLFTGYNFGSALQAYATKKTLNKLGYDSEILKISGSIVDGRDIRINKLIITFFRMLLYSKDKKAFLKSFKQNKKSEMNEKIIDEFNFFYSNYLDPNYIKYYQLKKKAYESEEYFKFLCGSDQIWNSTAFYVDPFYYLNFAPIDKRIAYAPSFGKTFIPNYNKKNIAKYIKNIPHISVREDSGKNIVKELIESEVDVCLDPSLLLDKEEWINYLNLKTDNRKGKYILCYFLNEPNDKARKMINILSEKYNLNVYWINKRYGENVIYGGPITFLNYLLNAEYVITDSFHGVAFSVNFNKKFYVFDRNYVTDNQSTRITSLLNKLEIEELFECDEMKENIFLSYEEINERLREYKNKSIKWLNSSIKNERRV